MEEVQGDAEEAQGLPGERDSLEGSGQTSC